MLYLDWRFLPVYDQIDPTTAHPGTYNVGLVALSVVVASLAAFVALSISPRIVAANTRPARWAWASAGAMAMGGGIWSMHFIGILANRRYGLGCAIHGLRGRRNALYGDAGVLVGSGQALLAIINDILDLS